MILFGAILIVFGIVCLFASDHAYENYAWSITKNRWSRIPALILGTAWISFAVGVIAVGISLGGI